MTPDIAAEKYVLVTTFRRDGRPVSAPVWIARLSPTEVCFTTGGESGKVKRIRHTARVTVEPCDIRGRRREGTKPLEGSARIATGPDFAPVRAAVAAKYGIQFRLIDWSGRLTSLVKRTSVADAGIVIRLEGERN